MGRLLTNWQAISSSSIIHVAVSAVMTTWSCMWVLQLWTNIIRLYPSTRLHGVTTQKIKIWVFNAVKISDRKKKNSQERFCPMELVNIEDLNFLTDQRSMSFLGPYYTVSQPGRSRYGSLTMQKSQIEKKLKKFWSMELVNIERFHF
jgi:hypothetical protein